jgi:hypothetical protein
MAEAILILAKSGMGKTTSLRNLEPEKTMVVQVKKKRLPFPHSNWKYWDKDKSAGSIFHVNTFEGMRAVLKKMEQVGKKIVVIDDLVYAISKKVMDDIDVKGFDYRLVA